MKILGVDEAGRGAVLGPLVICGFLIDKRDEEKLRELGVKDSKLLTPQKREELAPQLEKIASHIVIIRIPARIIDANRRKGINLNQIEALKMAEIINLLEPDKAYIDSPGYNSNKFRDYLFSKLENKKIKLICENFADKKYPVVSAASIIAKVERDRLIEELKKKVCYDFGVGYSHDKRCIEFLKKLAKENKGKMPSYVRTTWDTVKQIIEEYKQPKILSFLKKIVKKKTTS